MIYESEVDRENERRVILAVGKAWDFVPQFTQQFSRVDAIGWRRCFRCGEELFRVMILECKCRKENPWPTFAISNDKVEAGLLLSEQSHDGLLWPVPFNLPFYLIIEWPWGIHYLRVTRSRVIDRNFRGCNPDRPPELMAHFDLSLFRKVDDGKD